MELERHRSDEALLGQICRGSEAAFEALVERYHAVMVRIARMHVSSALAEEAAQEAWIAILKGCRRFERRSSFRTWMFRIVTNRAITHAERENRGRRLDRLEEDSIDADRFYPAGHPLEGTWIVPPAPWTPEERLLDSEIRTLIERTIAALPFLQRQVITLRDVEQWSAVEVCEFCGITESNQRVLLHRARAGVRRALEELLESEEPHHVG